ncbi:MAG: hypothetical protein WA324_27300 [Bryobacteraceae bacterium]
MPHQNISRPFGATQEEIADFQRHGAVCLRHLLTTEQVELLREGIESNLKHPSPRAEVASGEDDPGRFVEDFCCWQENNSYRRFIFESSIGAVAGQLMQSDTVGYTTIIC